MFELITSAVSGIIFGVMVGLLPGLPAYVAPLIVMPFAADLSVESILIFWLATHIGSQYFGSVATILLRIPGEVSGMIYLHHIKDFSLQQRLDLIRQTALGSSLGSVIALAALIVLYYTGVGSWLVALSTTESKFALLCVLAAVLIFSARQRVIAFILFAGGIALAEKTSFDLPIWLYATGEYTSNVTVFAVILGLLIIPEFVQELKRPSTMINQDLQQFRSNVLDVSSMWRGGVIGSVIGLFPGPNHIMSSVTAYHHRREPTARIIAAESANNSAIISSLMPFFFLGLPITISEFVLYDIMQVKSLVMPNIMFEPSAVWTAITRMELVFAMAIICVAVYTILAQKFLPVYAWIVTTIYQRLWFLFLIILAGLIALDIVYQYVVIWKYIVGLTLLTIIGLWLYSRKIDPLPAVFGFVLGDLLTWTASQLMALHIS